MLIDNGSVRTSHPDDLESDSHLLFLLLVFLVLQILQLLYERIPKVIEGIFMDWINRNYLIFFLVFFLLQLLILDFIVSHKVNKNLFQLGKLGQISILKRFMRFFPTTFGVNSLGSKKSCQQVFKSSSLIVFSLLQTRLCILIIPSSADSMLALYKNRKNLMLSCTSQMLLEPSSWRRLGMIWLSVLIIVWYSIKRSLQFLLCSNFFLRLLHSSSRSSN